ncbi:unnamed protein product [Paramecium primaurelia]|uniref:UBC core domain-containing protein n=1 Tax=Paramecium primaurelia TaxID=5886 RepID=A0A8S1L0B3_PARPR|nr:unnamed protein product [Paramecium primaurelia]
MAQQLSIQRLLREYDKLQKLNNNQFICEPNPTNIFEWHFVIYNLTDSFAGGYYHGILQMPPDYPLKPPTLKFITPSGRFEVGKPVCLSFTNFHPESWSSAQTIESMMISIISFMYTNENTTGGIISSHLEKQKQALNSKKFNLQNEQFTKIFKKHFDKLKLTDNYQNNQINDNCNNLSANIIVEEESSITAKQFFIGGPIILLLIYFLLQSIVE